MPEFFAESTYFGVFLSLLFYEVGLWCKKKWNFGPVNPFIISVVLTIVTLLLLKIPYQTYNAGAKIISFFLTPATICLAIPLYEQFQLLRKNRMAILAGILSGILTTMVLVLLFAVLFRFSHELYVTFLPKSITTAIGMGMSEKLGGNVSVTVIVIILTGVTGNILAEPILRLFHVTNPVAKGVGIGSASHAFGTAKALEIGAVEGAMSGLSIAVSGVLTVIFAIVFSYFY